MELDVVADFLLSFPAPGGLIIDREINPQNGLLSTEPIGDINVYVFRDIAACQAESVLEFMSWTRMPWSCASTEWLSACRSSHFGS